MFGGSFLFNIGEEVAMILFGIGFANLLFQKNLIKKIIGFNIMDTAIYLFLAEKGYISGRIAPIVVMEYKRLKSISIRYRVVWY